MKKYPKLVQSDKRGQIVIPKDIRAALNIQEGSGFWVYAVQDEAIILKKVEESDLEGSDLIDELKKKEKATGISATKIERTVSEYKKKKEGNLEYV